MFEAQRLREEIESGREVGEPTTMVYSVTGEHYVVIGRQISQPIVKGVVGEGQPRESAFDEETAYRLVLGAFRDYADGKSGKLYWRSEPLLEWSPRGNLCGYWVRLLISDKPVLPKDHPLVKSYWDDLAKRAA